MSWIMVNDYWKQLRQGLPDDFRQLVDLENTVSVEAEETGTGYVLKIKLPTAVSEEDVRAEFADGTLTLRLTKKEPVPNKSVKVKITKK